MSQTRLPLPTCSSGCPFRSQPTTGNRDLIPARRSTPIHWLAIGAILAWVASGLGCQANSAPKGKATPPVEQARSSDAHRPPPSPTVGSSSGDRKRLVDEDSPQAISARLTATAVVLIRAGQTDLALAQLQQALLKDKDNLEAIFRAMAILDDRGLQKSQAGDHAGGRADFLTAGVFARRIVTQGWLSRLTEQQQGWVANALYNEACAHSLLGDKTKALTALSMALESGFDHPERIQTDEDLKPLRYRAEFAELVRQYVRLEPSNQ